MEGFPIKDKMLSDMYLFLVQVPGAALGGGH